MDRYSRLTPLEIAGGFPIGLEPAGAIRRRPPTKGRSVPDALEAVLLPALEHTPCLVSFSGGRDSSLVLAAAVRAARRHGLPDPVPVTLRFPGVASAEESSWQDLMIQDLGLADWIRISARDRLELLGPEATGSLIRRGVLWPPTLHIFHVLLEPAAGGALVTGEGGDEYLGGRRGAALRYLLDRRGRIARRHARPLARAFAPAVVRRRRAVAAALRDGDRAWMHEPPRRQFLESIHRTESQQPLRWDRSLTWLDRRRGWTLGQRNRRRLADEYGVAVHDPLTDPQFTTQLAHAAGAAGFIDRTDILRRFFADLLPEAVITRRTKAHFSEAYSGPHIIEFAQTWDGTGVDQALVDHRELRSEWQTAAPHAGTLLLLHQAWIAQRAAHVGD